MAVIQALIMMVIVLTLVNVVVASTSATKMIPVVRVRTLPEGASSASLLSTRSSFINDRFCTTTMHKRRGGGDANVEVTSLSSSLSTSDLFRQIPRGGGGTTTTVMAEYDDEEETTTLAGTVVNTVQKISPLLANLILWLIQFVETLLDISLLPSSPVSNNVVQEVRIPKKAKQKSKKSNTITKKKKEQVVSQTDGDDDDEEDDQKIEHSKTDTVKKTKKKKKPTTKKAVEPEATTTTTKPVNKPTSTASLNSKKKSSATVKQQQQSQSHHPHLEKELKATNPNHRIQRELKEFMKSPPPNLKVNVGKNLRIWIVTLKGAKGTVYEDEIYKLRIQFPPRYPIVPPSVYFLKPTPRHEHVYTNGDICLSLLGKDWRPTMTAQSIAVSILSILSSARKKSLPMDNSRVASLQPGQPQDNWVYHDDNC